MPNQWTYDAEVCPHGHELTPENVYVDPRGTKNCRTCKRLRDRGRAKGNPKRSCSVEGCQNIFFARNMCAYHYRRLINLGESSVIKPTAQELFWAKVDKNGPIPQHRPELGECWVWSSHTTTVSGYGKVTIETVPYQAHRLSWQWEYGPIPDGLFVCHHCDNKPCVRPTHLFLGTQIDNMQDALSKGRFDAYRQRQRTQATR